MINVKNIKIGNNQPFVLLAGPCQIENINHARFMANSLLSITERAGVSLIYKSSFDKANRSSITSQRGIGIDNGLHILKTIKNEFGIPVLTDVHEIEQVKPVAEIVDVIQIPAFLCRQTSLLTEVAIQAKKNNCAVNIKKGQFLAPWDMVNVIEKFKANNFEDLMLCERGTTFGYNRLVSDLTSLPIMAKTGFPVIYDATHSVQQPGGLGESSGGNREMVAYLAKAAIAVGCAGLFIETHDDPNNAPSDGPNMININDLYKMLTEFKRIDSVVKSFN